MPSATPSDPIASGAAPMVVADAAAIARAVALVPPPACVIVDVANVADLGDALLDGAVAQLARRGPVVVVMDVRDAARGLRAGAQAVLPPGASADMRALAVETAMARHRVDAERAADLRMALEASRTGLWRVDVDTGHAEWSPEVFDIVGIPREDFEPARDSFFTLMHPDDVAPTRSVIDRAVSSREVFDVQFRVIGPDATKGVRWLHNRGRADYDAAGKPVRIVGTVTDVTTKRRVADELVDREQRYRLVADASNDAIWDWDLRSNEIVWNDGVRACFGYAKEDVLPSAQWWVDHIHPDDRTRVVDGIHAQIDNGPDEWCDEYRFQRADGTYAVVIDKGRVVRDEAARALRMVGAMRDRTEARRAEAALRSSEERFAFVRRSSGIGFFYCDLPFDVLQWDEHVKAHFFLPADAHVTIDLFYERIHPDDRATTRAAIARSIDEREPYDIQYRTMDLANGRERWVRAIGRTFYDDAGEPKHFDGVTLDVTEQKRAVDALREQDKRKDEFLATLAHELRNPLAPLRSGLEILLRDDEDASGGADAANANDDVRRARAMMDRQLTHLVHLVDDLLDISRVNRGAIPLRHERLTLRESVDAAIEAAGDLVQAKQHRVVVELGSEPLLLLADRTRVAQIITNLLTNAAKYSEPRSRILVEARREGAFAVLRVVDEGVGMAAETLPTIWDMFTQVRDTLDKAQGGLGIGLSLVKRLVELHGGSVAAESDGLGKGSTFTVRLPLADAAVAEPKPVSAPTVTRRRVLVVDDNEDGADSLAMVLRRRGHETATAYDGQAAVEMANTFRPEVIFLDIGLPILDGYDVARRLRAEPALSGALLIALTGWGSDDDKRKSREAGFDLHLTKPIDAAAVDGVLAGLR